VIFIPLTVLRVLVTVVLKEHFRTAEQLGGAFEKFVDWRGGGAGFGVGGEHDNKTAAGPRAQN
jgi:hypothetical protein